VLGVPLAQAAPGEAATLGWLAEFGWPTVLGMGFLGVGGATAGYVSVKLIWRLRIWTRRRWKKPG
jgi:hypothetical protein